MRSFANWSAMYSRSRTSQVGREPSNACYPGSAIVSRSSRKSYVKKLPGLLAKDYGRSAHYKPSQIKRTIERAGLDPIYSCYAIAMFSGREDFIQFHNDIGETCDYDAMRAEVAHGHFSGDVNFDVGDIVNLSEHGSDTSHPGSHDSGSGHGHSGD
jgi:hypothetical protein